MTAFQEIFEGPESRARAIARAEELHARTRDLFIVVESRNKFYVERGDELFLRTWEREVFRTKGE